MTKSLGEACDEIKNHGAKYGDFPVGSRVRVSTYCEDFFFFRATETGVVIENSGGYLGIKVKFDQPLEVEFVEGEFKYDHNFNPQSLRLIVEETVISRPYPFCYE